MTDGDCDDAPTGRINNFSKMADRILEFLSNLLKIGKEQLLLKSSLLRNKVPIKPVLGLTGLGVLYMAVRPLLSSKEGSENQVESTVSVDDKPTSEKQYSIKKTLYLMKEKEKLLRKQEGDSLEQKS